MRKLLLFVLVIITLLFVAIRSNNNQQEIKIRIVANSNSSIDQKEKEKIKEITIYYLDLCKKDTYDDCYKYINNTYKALERDLKKVYRNLSVDFSKHTLYNKTYNNNAIKNKECYTLYIVLGEGKGDNWWGSIYPKYLSNNTSDIKYESLLINVINTIKENYNDSN